MSFQCLACAEGCEECVDNSPCIVSLNMVLRSILLVLQCVIIGEQWLLCLGEMRLYALTLYSLHPSCGPSVTFKVFFFMIQRYIFEQVLA